MGNRETRRVAVCIFLTCVICGLYFKNIHCETMEGPENEVPMLYEVVQSKPDGENEYYVKTPKVEIIHRDLSYVTVAELCYEDGSRMKVTLHEEDETREITEWREGKTILTIWMETEAGEVLDGTKTEYIYFVDTKPAEVKLCTENGFSGWHKAAQKVTVHTEENGSGIEYVRCIVNGRVVTEEKNDSITFEVSENANGGNGVKLEVEAKDAAGHVSRKKELLYIDTKPPVLKVQGIKDGVVQNKDVLLTVESADNNCLNKKSLKVERKGSDGKRKDILKEWRETIRFTEEGSYVLVAALEDAAGNKTEQKFLFTIDKTKPEITQISKWNGVYLKKFIPDFKGSDIVTDVTDFNCEVFMDGHPYDLKTPVTKEGRHNLHVKAVDTAGNFSEADAVFYIDRTKPEIIIGGVSDRKEYVDEAEWNVKLMNRGDRIVGVWINGEQCAWKETYQTKEPGTYQILVRAIDAAGNRSVKEIKFSVKEMPQIEKQWKVPFKERIGFKMQSGTMTENESENGRMILLWFAIGCIVCVGALLGYKKTTTKRKKKNNLSENCKTSTIDNDY